MFALAPRPTACASAAASALHEMTLKRHDLAREAVGWMRGLGRGLFWAC